MYYAGKQVQTFTNVLMNYLRSVISSLYLPVIVTIPIPTTDLLPHYISAVVETTTDWLNLLKREIHHCPVQEQEGDMETENVDL
jgi:hypothetical protein